MSSELQARYDAVRREMVEQYQRTAAVENHGLLYTLFGWQFLAACVAAYLCLHVFDIQQRWVYFAIKVTQILLFVLTIRLVIGRRTSERSPLEPISKRLWIVYLLLCINIDFLNVVADKPIATHLPALAVLTSFAFSFMTSMFSRRFMLAGNLMVPAGILMAVYPVYGQLIYGVAWLLILQGLGLWFWFDRKHWLAASTSNTVPRRQELIQTSKPVAAN
jgi:hypothetical protein